MNTEDSQKRFRALLEEHKRLLFKVCHSYTNNADDRDDLAQEITIQLWRAFHSFDGRAKFSTWMYRVALNVAISYQRREKGSRTERIPDDERLFVLEPSVSQPEEIQMLYQFIATSPNTTPVEGVR